MGTPEESEGLRTRDTRELARSSLQHHSFLTFFLPLSLTHTLLPSIHIPLHNHSLLFASIPFSLSSSLKKDGRSRPLFSHVEIVGREKGEEKKPKLPPPPGSSAQSRSAPFLSFSHSVFSLPLPLSPESTTFSPFETLREKLPRSKQFFKRDIAFSSITTWKFTIISQLGALSFLHRRPNTPASFGC